MKKFQIKLFIFLIIFGCKEKNEMEKPISENWQLVSNESIQYGYRDIRATEVIGDELLIMSSNSLYFFDTFILQSFNPVIFFLFIYLRQIFHL